MNKFYLWAPLFVLHSCIAPVDSDYVYELSPQKKRHKIAVLQKKLAMAERERDKVDREVEDLSTELDRLQLSLIHLQLNEYEEKGGKKTYQFLEEREVLYDMIDMGPSPTAFEAQVELDRILRLLDEAEG